MTNNPSLFVQNSASWSLILVELGGNESLDVHRAASEGFVNPILPEIAEQLSILHSEVEGRDDLFFYVHTVYDIDWAYGEYGREQI